MFSAAPATLGLAGAHRLEDILPEIRARLARHVPRRVGDHPDVPGHVDDGERTSPRRRAAVALILFEHRFGGGTGRSGQDSAPAFLMIKRGPRGPFPGQWALPGGRLASGEDDVAAALRETAEEVGAELGPGELLGALDDVPTAGGTVIAPLVFAAEGPVRFRRDPREIHSLHPIRLRRLTEAGVPRWRRAPGAESLLQMPLRRDMIVHAPTGAILWQFAQIGLRGVPQEVAGLAQPAFLATRVPRSS